MSLDVTSKLEKTTYDRKACAIGVIHLGFGAFHRGHQSVYVDDVMEKTGDLRWGIAAVNLRAADAAAFAEHARETDGYIVKAMSPDGAVSHRSVRSHVAYCDWSTTPVEAEALMALGSVHLVTITVTESGYFTDPAGALNGNDPVIMDEMAGGTPVSVYAYLTAALSARQQATGQKLTIMCCDNIRQNGKMLQRNFDSYLRLAGHLELADWVSENVTFPCSMVDRITPRATPELRTEVEASYGANPASPIMAETFSQWVLEDRFAGPRPDFGAVGVTVTDDVDPYEETKIRILNGGHTCLSYMAALKGIATFDSAMADPDLNTHFWNYEQGEVLPAITIDLPFDKAAYLDSIAARFGNSSIADSIERICADGFAKFPIFVRPTLEGCLKQGKMPVMGLRSAASWYIFAKHIAAGKLGISYLEPSWDLLEPMLTSDGLDGFTRSKPLWGDLPEQYPDFAPTLQAQIKELEKTWPV